MEKKKVPALRFRGFHDDWEQCKLGDVVEFLDTMRKPLEGAKRVPGPYPYYGASGIVDYVDGYLFDEELVLFSEDGANITDRNYPVCFLATGKYWVNNHVHVLRTKKENENNFICNALERKDYTQFNTGMAMPKLNKETCKNIPISCPVFQEQKKIGDYFRDLDHLITLHQRKYEKLQKLKKAMLEKMFPKTGCSVPEIRFQGFTDDWEQRKVTELGKIYIGLVTTMTKHYTNEGTLLIRNSDIKDGRFEFGDTPIYLENTFAQENESRMHQIGDVITVHTGDVGTSAVITENEAKSIGFATIVTRPDTQIIDPNYLCTFLNTDKHKRWAVVISTGDGRTNYNLGDYYELVVPVPSIREQQAISSFVQNLNNLITLHQRKLEKLKNLKKACLEKMFV